MGAITQQLEDEGVTLFAAAYADVIADIEQKRSRHRRS
jgi:hypothetical protein